MSFLLALTLAFGASARTLEPDPRLCAAAEGLTLVRIEGALDIGTQALLKRAIDGARERGDRLVLELDTPGGEIELMWQLAKALLKASDKGLVTVAWVNDRALSAGSLLALACERVYMCKHATLGSALPVQIGPGGLEPASEDEQVREKIYSHLRAEFRGVAERRGRSGLLAEAMVDPEVEVTEVILESGSKLVSGKELEDLNKRGERYDIGRTVVARGELLNAIGSEAVALGLADGLAESIEELAAKLGLAGVVPSEVRRARSEDLATWLDTLSPLFLIAGFVCLYLELKVPGLSLAGVLSILSFGVVLFGRYLVGLADVPHLILIVGGAALIAVELFLMPGTLWPGLLGALAILFGLIWSFVGSSIGFEYGLDRTILVEESWRVVGAGFLALLVIWGLSRLLPHTPFFSRMVLAGGANVRAGTMPEASGERAEVARVGASGRATTALRPVGKVALDGDPALEFEARSSGALLERGARVRVVEVSAARLVVEPAEEARA